MSMEHGYCAGLKYFREDIAYEHYLEVQAEKKKEMQTAAANPNKSK